jgi:dihydroneopterin aldolase
LRPAVVKVGGSFARYSRLGDLVRALEMGRGRVVIVPGGGPFADIVRREQLKIGYDDSSAHRMALLAMAQFGLALASRSLVLKPAANVAAIEHALEEEKVPVWLPLDILDGDPGIPESWEVTSDSLAAWLAGRLDASRLIFLKRATPASLKTSDLVAAGVLDPLTPHFLAKTNVEAWLCGPRQLTRLGQALAEDADIGRRIDVV